MKKIAVIAPHPDDETLGCGGALLKYKAAGAEIYWIIVTKMTEALGYTQEAIARREKTIEKAKVLYGFSETLFVNLPTTKLDSFSKSDIIDDFKRCLDYIKPSELYLPFPGDVHNDHAITFELALSCSKWFRGPYIKKILCYETLSETEQGLDPRYRPFSPNVWVDIEAFLEMKLRIMKECYEGEMGIFPFPRSMESIRALAHLRGSAMGLNAAEAFQLIKEIQ